MDSVTLLERPTATVTLEADEHAIGLKPFGRGLFPRLTSMDASTIALLLMAVGLVLIVAEVFIPSGGAVSVCSAITILTGVYYAWSAWGTSSPLKLVAYLASLSILIPTGIGTALYMLPHTRVGKAAILSGPTPEETDAFGDLERKHAAFVGQFGVTVSVLNPAGTVRIGGERVACQSEGSIIDPGVTVRIVSARYNFVIVRAATGPELAALATGGTSISPDPALSSPVLSPPALETSAHSEIDAPAPTAAGNHRSAQKPGEHPADIDFDLS
jgi:membrane protein implicated in regulation of membrane protease activity